MSLSLLYRLPCISHKEGAVPRKLLWSKCLTSSQSVQVSFQGEAQKWMFLFFFEINFTYLSIKYMILSISLFCIVQNTDFYL